MRNKYWYEREALHYKQNLVKLGTYNKRLERLYMRSYNAVEKEIADFYAKYARDNGLTLAMAKQKIDKFDVEAFQDRLQELLKKKKLSKKARQELVLYNATMRLNRLELLKANIGLSLVENFQDAEDTFEEALDEDAISEYRRQSGILGSTTRDMPKATLSAVVGGSFHNATFSDRIWAHQDELRYTLEGMLTQGLIQGRNPRSYISALRKAFDTSKYNAERLLRTEWARVQTDSATAVMRDNDVEQYVFIANGTACKTCSSLNGQHFRVSEQHVGDNAPPVHPNCMCAIAPLSDREASENEMYRSTIPNRYVDERGNEIIDRALYNRLTKDFLKHGGIIKRGKEAEDHLGERATASYIAGGNIAFIKDNATVSDVLEEMYHAHQDRVHAFGEVATAEVILQREIEAQEYLLSVAKKYKINSKEQAVTRANLQRYIGELEQLRRQNGIHDNR